MTNIQQRSVLLFIAVFLIAGCHKKTQNTVFEQFFEDNVLDQTFIITLAKNQGTDLTDQYSGYTFILKKGSDYYNGPLLVAKSGSNYNGTWSSNEDYSKLRISLPNSPIEFQFLNRDWRFASKALPTLKFTPWGSTDDIQLTMLRQ